MLTANASNKVVPAGNVGPVVKSIIWLMMNTEPEQPCLQPGSSHAMQTPVTVILLLQVFGDYPA